MSKRKLFREQDELEEQEILASQTKQDPMQSALDYFFAEGMISEVLYTVKSGKEATVYCCQAQPSMGVDLLAAKVYRPRNNRGFKNDSMYQEGRVILKGQVRRAVENKTRFGRKAQFAIWVNYEFEALNTLYKAGADIPRPLASTDNAILMEYVGDRQWAAPALQHVELHRGDARRVFDQLMGNVELWLAHNYIHADLSAYNVLYWMGKARIIDFPQVVDPRFNPNALTLLTRDIENICRYVARYGLERDGQRIAQELWWKFKNAVL
jgi:RIO kinase 1